MNSKYFFLLVFLLAACLSRLASADTYTVVNTNDSGSGSLRQALLDANTNGGADTVTFNIPAADANYNAALGVWTIAPLLALPIFLDDGTMIDGTSQAIFIGTDSNPAGPEIELDGTQAGDVDGLYILSSNNAITGLVINRFKHFGIQMTFNHAQHNVVSGCYVGVDATGTSDQGNGFSGIIMYNGASKNRVGGTKIAERNVVSGNDWSGVEIQAWNADSNVVIGNYIGTDVTGSKDLGNSSYGVYIWSGARGNVIGGRTAEERNIISANHWDGVALIGPGTDDNIVIGNYIGTDRSGTEPLPNGFNGITIGSRNKHNLIGGIIAGQGNLISGNGNYGIGVFGSTENIIAGNLIGVDATGAMIPGNKMYGIYLGYGSRMNKVGPGNVIANNGSDGIRVEHDTTITNTITQNSIYSNSGLGIDNIDGGNTELQPPIISMVTSTSVSGTTLPNSRVEIFFDREDEGGLFEGQVLSDAAGNFSWTGTANGPNITATVTDALGNTSEFSQPYVTNIEDANPMTAPAKFALQQNNPNPFNPTTTIRFDLPKQSQVEIVIFNILSQPIRHLLMGNYSAGMHTVTWNGQNDNGLKASIGVYFYRMQADGFVEIRKMILMQ